MIRPSPASAAAWANVARRVGVAPREVGVAERVHQVVRGVAAREGGGQRLGLVHVAVDRAARARVGVGMAGHRLHGVARGLELRAQPPTDESR